MSLQARNQIRVRGNIKHECVNCLTAFTETRKVPSFEGASFIGPSHSLTGVRSTTVFKCVATPSVKWCHVLPGVGTSVHIVSRSIRSRTGYELRGNRVTRTASAWPCRGLPRRPSVYQNHPWCLNTEMSSSRPSASVPHRPRPWSALS